MKQTKKQRRVFRFAGIANRNVDISFNSYRFKFTKTESKKENLQQGGI